MGNFLFENNNNKLVEQERIYTSREANIKFQTKPPVILNIKKK